MPIRSNPVSCPCIDYLLRIMVTREASLRRVWDLISPVVVLDRHDQTQNERNNNTATSKKTAASETKARASQKEVVVESHPRSRRNESSQSVCTVRNADQKQSLAIVVVLELSTLLPAL